jgi:hypothetical protein
MLRILLTILAAGLLMLLGISPCQAGAISVNSVCELGNCASPDIVAANSMLSVGFNFTFTFANTDSYQISGTLSGVDNAGNRWSIGVSNTTVTYLGNSSGTASSTDVLTIDFLQNFAWVLTSGDNFTEGASISFGGDIASGSDVTNQLIIGAIPSRFWGHLPLRKAQSPLSGGLA